MLSFLNSSQIYVSQAYGDDWKCNGFSPLKSNKGEGPLETIERALEMIYKMRSSGNMQPMTVNVIGDYYIEKPIVIGLEALPTIIDKNASIYGITFAGYGEKKARIIGGRHIENLKVDTFNGVACFSAELPQIKTGEWSFTDLYVNGRRALSTRYPEKGTLRAVTTPTPNVALPGEEYQSSNWFIAKKQDLDGITGVENAIVSFYHWWIDEHSPITEYDKETGRITMEYYSRMTISAEYEKEHTSNLEYYLENVPQMFKNKGEWYFDKEHGKIYYIPREGETLENTEAFAPVADKLICIAGREDNKVESICFKNLEVLCSKGDFKATQANVPDKFFASSGQSACDANAAVTFVNAVNCSLNNCSFYALGLHAVEIKTGCSSLRIENCRFDELGAGGIKIFGAAAGEEEIKETHHNVIKGNKISNCGKRYAAGCGILACHTYQNEISENEICYLDYSGISVGWVWGYNSSNTYGNLIRNNHIHHIGMGRLSDMGGIYLLGRQKGTVLDGNIIHDINSNHYGGNGIYADEGSSYLTVQNNVVYNCKSVAYNQHFGTYNVVKNNIFAFGGESVINVYNKDNTNIGTLFEQNVFLTNQRPVYHFEPFNKYPSPGINSNSNKIWDISGGEPIIYDSGENTYTLNEWQRIFGRDENSSVNNPGFADPENGNFEAESTVKII